LNILFNLEDKSVAHRGVVKWFDDIKGYGYIQSESGQEVFVHFSEIIQQKGFRSLSPGTFVEFEMLGGEKGPKAMNVITVPGNNSSEKSRPR
jgi:CspA family cold shock protein